MIDDGELTSCLYPCDLESWKIALDPTGMVARARAGEADTVRSWKMKTAEEERTFVP